MLNIKKMIRILPITFIFMYAVGVFGMIIGVSSRNNDLVEISKLFSTYSLVPAFLVTVIFSLIRIDNKQAKLVLYTVLFVAGVIGLFIYLANTNYLDLEMMQNLILFPVLFISVLGVVFFELKHLKD